MVKKVKNSSQSGKTNIADELNAVIETALPTVEETKAELQPVVTKVVTEALEEKVGLNDPTLRKAMEDAIRAEPEFGNNKMVDFEALDQDSGERQSDVIGITEEPIMYIGSKRIKLTPKEPGHSPFINRDYNTRSNHSIVTSTRPHHSSGRYQDYQIKDDLEIKWWTAVVDGIVFNLSSGSYLEIRESLDAWGRSYDSFGAEMRLGPQTNELTLLTSRLICDHLCPSGKNVLNNSTIDAGHYIHLFSATMACTTMIAEFNIDVKYSRVSQTSIYSANYVRIEDKSHIDGLYLSGLSRIVLVDTRILDGFKLSMHGRHDSPKPTLEIKGHSVASYDAYYGDIEQAFKVYRDMNKHYCDMDLIIERRIDYGTFSGITDMPFIRVGENSMLVGGELFTAEEFFGSAGQETQPKPVDPTAYRSEETTWRPNFGVGVLGVGNYYKGSLVWNRAAKVLYGHKHRRLVVGKSAESMVNTLVEQIKSRIGLYVEIGNMGL